MKAPTLMPCSLLGVDQIVNGQMPRPNHSDSNRCCFEPPRHCEDPARSEGYEAIFQCNYGGIAALPWVARKDGQVKLQRHQKRLTAFRVWGTDRNKPFLSERADREEVLKPCNNMPPKVEEELGHSRVLVLCVCATALRADWAQSEAATFGRGPTCPCATR